MTDEASSSCSKEEETKNLCDKVRTSCRRWMTSDEEHKKRSVTLHSSKIPALASQILSNDTAIAWDDEQWHYTGSNYTGGSKAQRKERVALFLLALDAINFCFWPMTDEDVDDSKETNSLEYEHLTVALKRLAEQDDNDDNHNHSADHKEEDGISITRSSPTFAFSPQQLQSMTSDRMRGLLEPHLDGHVLPNIEQRCQLWNEVGTVLLNNFQGSATYLLDQAHGSAPQLVDLVYQNFPGFRDTVRLPSSKTTIYFLKRAQILVGDLNAALELQLKDLDQLTTFADYRVPQLLRHVGVLEYSTELATKVDSYQELEQNSEWELSIRAGTVVAVEELVDYLNSHSKSNSKEYTAVSIDWYLWQVGEKLHQQGQLQPFHRVRTHFY